DAVLIDVGSGIVLTGQTFDLDEDVANGVGVDSRPQLVVEVVLDLEHLEDVELDVAKVRLVVAHALDRNLSGHSISRDLRPTPEPPARRLPSPPYALPTWNRGPGTHPQRNPQPDRRRRARGDHHQGNLLPSRGPSRQLLQPLRLQGTGHPHR